MGSYGTNHLIITPEYGPRVRIIAILTDLEIPHESHETKFISDLCKDCNICVEVCPVGAIGEDGTIEIFACRDYMFKTLEGLRCGLCLKACPLNRL